MSSLVVSPVAEAVVVLVVVTTWREEEDKICKVKKSPFSKQVGVVLER